MRCAMIAGTKHGPTLTSIVVSACSTVAHSAVIVVWHAYKPRLPELVLQPATLSFSLPPLPNRPLYLTQSLAQPACHAKRSLGKLDGLPLIIPGANTLPAHRVTSRDTALKTRKIDGHPHQVGRLPPGGHRVRIGNGTRGG